jgi:hypothetical protein
MQESLARCSLKHTQRSKNMTRQTIAAAFVSIAAPLIVTSSAHGGVIQTLASYDSSTGYDYDTTFPTPGQSTTIGTYTFAIPAGANVTGITISGTFGNGDVPNTALSDYYLGFSGDETAVEVAACDSILNNCYSGQEGPYFWTATLTPAEIADLVPALTAGSLNFTYTWDSSPPAEPIPDLFSSTGYDDQYVYAGAATIDISYTPEPATLLLCLSGLTIVVALRPFRKVRFPQTDQGEIRR